MNTQETKNGCELTIPISEHYARFERRLRALSDYQLVERQIAQWQIGAVDDAHFVALCVPIKSPQDREEVIQFLLGCEVNYWHGTESIAAAESEEFMPEKTNGGQAEAEPPSST